MWRFVDAGDLDGYFSAALFESIGRAVGRGDSPETVLLWRVHSPAVYVGYHQIVKKELHTDFCRLNNIPIVRRVLGGGCGFCDHDQILYSVAGREGETLPYDIRRAYEKVLSGVIEALHIFGICAVIEPGRNAICAAGRKISGNAQGRFGGAVLVNGSLLLDFNFYLMDRVLVNPVANLKKGIARAHEGMTSLSELLGTYPDDGDVKKALRRGFENALGTSYDGELSEHELDDASMNVRRYMQDAWIYRMDLKRDMIVKAHH